MANYSAKSTINLEVNGSQAKKMLDDLKQKASNLSKEMQKAADAGDKVKIKKIQKDLNDTNRLMAQLTSETKQVSDVMARLDKATPKELKKTLSSLQRDLQKMERGSEAWSRQAEKIRMVKAEIDKVNASLRESQSALDRFNDFWGRTQTLILGAVAAITGLVMAGRKAVNAYADMEQEMANVRKYTGMDADEVAALNDEFKKIDTRSPREELNKLAQEAGRLGKTSQEDVLGFVRAADKINVALDDLGDGATLTLSKLTGIFGDEERLGTEKALLSVGSVINELSQNCSASAPYLAEFASRVGGVGAQAGMTVQQIMGYAAVLDSNNQKLEASATALSQVMVRIYQDPAKYAKVAGLDIKNFAALVKEDMNSALIELLSALNAAGSMDVLSPMFKDMGENGSRAISALSTLAGHIEEVKAQQLVANEAFEDATSIDTEFAVQNNTVAAGLEKAKNRVHEIAVELGEKLQPVMRYAISSSTIALKSLSAMVDFFIKYKREIITLTAVIVAYNAVMLVYNTRTALATKATVIFHGALKVMRGIVPVLQLLFTPLINAVQYFTNGLQVNYAMQLRWQKAMAAMKLSNWVALILSAAAAVYLLAKRWAEHTTEAQRTAKMYEEIEAKAVESTATQVKKLDELYARTQDQNLAQEERIKAIERLRAIYPEYFKDISNEAFLAGQAAEAYNTLRNSILDAARARGREDMIAKLEGEIQELNGKLQDESKHWIEKRLKLRFKYENDPEKLNSDPDYRLANWNINAIEAKYKPSIDSKVKLQNELASKNADYEINNPQSKDGDGTEEVHETPTYTPTLSDKERKKLEAEARRAAIKARKEFKSELNAIKAERDNEIASLMMQRSAGEMNYKDYTEAKFAAEKKFYDDSIALYEKWNLKEDDDHAALMKKREEHEAKFKEVKLNLNKEVIRRVAAEEERDINYRYSFKKNKTLSDEMRLQEELLKVRYNALTEEQKLYDAGSKEYEEMELKIQDLLYNDMLAKKKLLFDKEKEFRQKFDKLSVKEKFDLELSALQTLYDNKKISEDEFQRWKAALEKGYAKDSAEEKKSLPGTAKDSNKTKAKEARKQFDSKKSDLDDALRKGIIDENEYAQRLSRIKAEMNAALVDPLRTAQSEWVAMLTNAYQSWTDFAAALNDPEADPFSAMADGIAATAAIVGAVMEQMTAFSKAELEIQTKAVEKRYDREIAYAEGNAYLTKKLEKEKQEELNELKAEQAKKDFAMQVIATIAQTAANAVEAYGAALKIPGAGLVLAPIAAAMAVAQGAVQIALLKKQQQAAAAVGYSEGGFTRPGQKDEPAGIVHAGEWVASQKLVNSPQARPLIEMLEYAQRTNRIGSITMQDVSRSVAAPMFNAYAPAATAPAVVVTQPSAPASSAEESGLSEAIARLNSRLDRPFVTVNSITGENGIKEAERKYNRMINNKSRKSRG